jgi:uncharacterized repeat protein (TIGR02543 family)
VVHGQAATAPAAPKREGYTFDGWDTDFSRVTSDLNVTAKWKQNSYTVTFKNGYSPEKTYLIWLECIV